MICIKLHFYCTVGWQMKNIYIVAHDDWIWLKIYFTGIRCDGKCEHKKCEFIEKFTSEHADHRLFARVWSSFTRRLTLISWLKFVSCSFVSLYVPNSLMLSMLFRCAHQRDDEAPRNFSSLAKLRLLFLALRRAYSNIHVTLVSHSTADWKRSWYVFQQENSLKAVERKRKTWNVYFFFFFFVVVFIKVDSHRTEKEGKKVSNSICVDKRRLHALLEVFCSLLAELISILDLIALLWVSCFITTSMQQSLESGWTVLRACIIMKFVKLIIHNYNFKVSFGTFFRRQRHLNYFHREFRLLKLFELFRRQCLRLRFSFDQSRSLA